ncbi:MAG: TrkA family potassium uptake protein [Candidatus Caldatribacteriota bacterium]|nr:TrkA family potassium uptake protein [Candidatus Caldatribacteriota bacterium]
MKQFIVLGLGRFGSAVATTLVELGHEVLGVDNDEERVDALKDKITQAVQADITEERVLKELGVKNFDAAIVSIATDLEASILVTMMLKEMGLKYIIAKAQSALHGKVLEKIGVDKIVFPERDMGARIARRLITPNIRDYVELEPDYSIIEIEALPEFVDKSLSELDLRNKYGINVLVIKRDNGFNISPQAKDVIKKDDLLIVIGKTKIITELVGKANN